MTSPHSNLTQNDPLLPSLIPVASHQASDSSSQSSSDSLEDEPMTTRGNNKRGRNHSGSDTESKKQKKGSTATEKDKSAEKKRQEKAAEQEEKEQTRADKEQKKAKKKANKKTRKNRSDQAEEHPNDSPDLSSSEDANALREVAAPEKSLSEISTAQADHIDAILPSMQQSDTQLQEGKNKYDNLVSATASSLRLLQPETMATMVPAGSSVMDLFVDVDDTLTNFHRNALINVGAATIALTPAQALVVMNQARDVVENLQTSVFVGYLMNAAYINLDLKDAEVEQVKTQEGFLRLLATGNRRGESFDRCKRWWNSIKPGDPYRGPPTKGKSLQTYQQLDTKFKQGQISLEEFEKQQPEVRKNEAKAYAGIGLLCLELSFTKAWPKIQRLLYQVNRTIQVSLWNNWIVSQELFLRTLSTVHTIQQAGQNVTNLHTVNVCSHIKSQHLNKFRTWELQAAKLHGKELKDQADAIANEMNPKFQRNLLSQVCSLDDSKLADEDFNSVHWDDNVVLLKEDIKMLTTKAYKPKPPKTKKGAGAPQISFGGLGSVEEGAGENENGGAGENENGEGAGDEEDNAANDADDEGVGTTAVATATGGIRLSARKPGTGDRVYYEQSSTSPKKRPNHATELKRMRQQQQRTEVAEAEQKAEEVEQKAAEQAEGFVSPNPPDGHLNFLATLDRLDVVQWNAYYGHQSAVAATTTTKQYLSQQVRTPPEFRFLRFLPPANRGVYLLGLFRLLRQTATLHFPLLHKDQFAVNTTDGSFHAAIQLECLDGAAPLSRLLDPYDSLNPRPSQMSQLEQAQRACANSLTEALELDDAIRSAEAEEESMTDVTQIPALQAHLEALHKQRNDFQAVSDAAFTALGEAKRTISKASSSLPPSFLRNQLSRPFTSVSTDSHEIQAEADEAIRVRRPVVVQALQCVQFIHSDGIAHRDLVLKHLLVQSPIVLQQLQARGAVIAEHKNEELTILTIKEDNHARNTFFTKYYHHSLTMQAMISRSQGGTINPALLFEQEQIVEKNYRVVLDGDLRHSRVIQRLNDKTKDPPYHMPSAQEIVDEVQYPHKFLGSRLVNSATWYQEMFVDHLTDLVILNVAQKAELDKLLGVDLSTLCQPAVEIMATLSYDMFAVFLVVLQLFGAFTLDSIQDPAPPPPASPVAPAGSNPPVDGDSDMKDSSPPPPPPAAAPAEVAPLAVAPEVSSGVRALLVHFQDWSRVEHDAGRMPNVFDFFMRAKFECFPLKVCRWSAKAKDGVPGSISQVASPAYPVQMHEGVKVFRRAMDERAELAILLRLCAAPRFHYSLESILNHDVPTIDQVLTELITPSPPPAEIVRQRFQDLGLEYVPIRGDGDCLPHTLSHQVHQLDEKQRDAIAAESSLSKKLLEASLMDGSPLASSQGPAVVQARSQRVVAQRKVFHALLMKQFREFPSSFPKGDEESDQAFKKRITDKIAKVKELGFYADDVCNGLMQAIATTMNVQITCMLGRPRQDHYIRRPDTTRDPHAVFVIHLINSNHFNSSKPIGSGGPSDETNEEVDQPMQEEQQQPPQEQDDTMIPGTPEEPEEPDDTMIPAGPVNQELEDAQQAVGEAEAKLNAAKAAVAKAQSTKAQGRAARVTKAQNQQTTAEEELQQAKERLEQQKNKKPVGRRARIGAQAAAEVAAAQ